MMRASRVRFSDAVLTFLAARRPSRLMRGRAAIAIRFPVALAVAGAVAACAGGAARDAAPGPEAPSAPAAQVCELSIPGRSAEYPDRIARLIADLDSDNFARREAATKALIEAGDDAIPSLEEAAENTPLEVQARAREALNAIEGREIQHEKVFAILHGPAAFVEGEGLSLREALKPVEKLGLRVYYDKDVDAARLCRLRKNGETALELIDQLAKTERLGFRIVPGGVRVVSQPTLDASIAEMRRRLEKPLTVEFEDVPLEKVMNQLSDNLGVVIVLSPDVKENQNADTKVTLKFQRIRDVTVLNLIL
jgi:hypothetical protein